MVMLTITSIIGNIFDDKKLMARFKQMGFQGHAYPKPGHGAITTPSGELFCPTEYAVFAALGWPYLYPQERH